MPFDANFAVEGQPYALSSHFQTSIYQTGAEGAAAEKLDAKTQDDCV